jgi:hypothetical protein
LPERVHRGGASRHHSLRLRRTLARALDLLPEERAVAAVSDRYADEQSSVMVSPASRGNEADQPRGR